MAETELTKSIKRALRGYRPIINSKMRTIRWAEEVDVGTGFVDFIRFEDYIVSQNKFYKCNKEEDVKIIDDFKNPICKEKDTCVGCIFKSSECTEKVLGIATTCFEIKISKSDFKSKHGHNFVGNYNYYVAPKELYSQIETLVPENIGVILYSGHGALRIKKECVYKNIESDKLSLYLYNAMKKWCDLSYFNFQKMF